MTTGTERHGSSLALAMLLMLVDAIGPVLAHPGHADPVTISRATAGHVKQLVGPYLQLHEALAAGRFDAAAADAASRVKQIAEQARDTETDASGKRMYRAVAAAAAELAAAPDLATARGHFSALNDALLPFFDAWQNYRSADDVIIYVCKSSEQWWMQKRGPAALPYDGGMAACGELVNTKKEDE